MSGIRPVRRRKSVSHYSDDNPNTFTVKPKRGQAAQLDEQQKEDEEPLAEYTSAAAGVTSKRKKVSRNNNNKNSSLLTSSTDQAAVTPTSKSTPSLWASASPYSPKSPSVARKRPRIRILPDDSESADEEWQNPTAGDHHQDQRMVVLTHAFAVQPIVHLPQEPQHQQLFPPPLTSVPLRPSQWQSVNSAYSGALLQRKGAKPGDIVTVPPPAITAWSMRRSDGALCLGDCAGGLVLFTSTSTNQQQQLIRTTAWQREQERPLVSKKLVAWPNAVQQTSWTGEWMVTVTNQELEVWTVHHECLVSLNLSTAVGATLGTVSSSSGSIGMGCSVSPTLRQVLYTTNNGASHPTVEDTHDTKESSSLSSLPTALVSLWVPPSSRTTTRRFTTPPCTTKTMTPRPTHPPKVTRLATQFHCYSAIWEETSRNNNKTTNSQPPTALLVARHIQEPSRVDLVRLEGTHLDTIRQQVTLWEMPNQMAATHSRLAQVQLVLPSPQQQQQQQQQQQPSFLFVLGLPDGIRMVDVDSLVTMQVFGAAVTLHGKSLQWHDCQWIPAPSAYTTGKRKHGVVWKEPTAPNDTTSSTEHWLIGVPHPFKGPDELQSTLYVWDANGRQVTTLPTPQDGPCLGLRARNHPTWGWELTAVSAVQGQVWEWKPTVQSDFAGIEYNVGYKVVHDNVEYIEDEGELDQRIVVLEEYEDDEDDIDGSNKNNNNNIMNKANDQSLPLIPMASSNEEMGDNDDEALKRALKLSLLENAPLPKIHVLADEEEDDTEESLWIPCRPDPALVSNRNQHGDSDSETAAAAAQQSPEPSRKDGFTSDILLAMPQTRAVRQFFRRRQEQRATLSEQLSSSNDVPLIEPPKIKGKRTKVPNVELLMQSSIKPELRRYMEERQTGLKRPSAAEEKEVALELLLLSPSSKATEEKEKNDSGSNNTPNNDNIKKLPQQQQPQQCPACRGRMVLHTCGKRAKPIDYDAIERAEEERKAKEKAEKHKHRQAKRRAADARRREARKKKKEEEERKQQEEEQQRLEVERNRRQQEEHMRRLEEDQFEHANIREHEEEPTRAFSARIPVSTPYQSTYGQTSSREAYYGDSNTDGYSSSHYAWSQQQHRRGSVHPSESYSAVSSASSRKEPLRIEGKEVQPSTSLKESDALAALAGLADSMPAAPPVPANVNDASTSAFPPAPASWYSREESETGAQPTQDSGTAFVYRGSQERRAAIAQAFLGDFDMGTASPPPSSSPQVGAGAAATDANGYTHNSGGAGAQPPIPNQAHQDEVATNYSTVQPAGPTAGEVPPDAFDGVRPEAYHNGVVKDQPSEALPTSQSYEARPRGGST